MWPDILVPMLRMRKRRGPGHTARTGWSWEPPRRAGSLRVPKPPVLLGVRLREGNRFGSRVALPSRSWPSVSVVRTAEIHAKVASLSLQQQAGRTDAPATGLRTLTLPAEEGCVRPSYPGGRCPVTVRDPVMSGLWAPREAPPEQAPRAARQGEGTRHLHLQGDSVPAVTGDSPSLFWPGRLPMAPGEP